MRKSYLIIKREYLTRVRKRSFIIMTLLMPLLLAGMGWLVAYLSLDSGSQKEIAILDNSHFFENHLKAGGTINYHFVAADTNTLKNAVISKKYDAALIIPPFNIQQKADLELFSREQLGLSAQMQITDALNKAIIQQRLINNGISKEEINNLHAQTISLNNISEKGNKGSGLASFAIGYGCGILLYFFMLFYGMSVMRSVMEEKTNRIAEIIISSVKPYQLMLGKILGVALVGLTQFLIWIVLFLIVAGLGLGSMGVNMLHGGALTPDMMQQASSAQNAQFIAGLQSILTDTNWSFILLWFLFYFLGGYFLYAALYAAVGSLVNEDPQESQQFTLPITLPIIIAFFLMTAALQDPNSGLAIFGSLFPLTSPIVMMARIPYGVPGWQLLLSAIFLILGFIATTGLAAKIYRTGILMYGKKITVKEVFKWILK